MGPQDTESADWNEIIAWLGGEAELAQTALAHGALVRARAVRSASDLLRLAFIYGPGGHSLRVTTALAEMGQIAELSDVALMNRLAGAADWLKALCESQIAKLAAPAAGLRLRIVDSTTIAGPGKAYRHRLHLSYDPTRQRIGNLQLTSTKLGERLDRIAPGAGELILADRGYPKPDGLARLLKAGAQLLVRITWKSLHLRDDKGKSLNWKALFKAAKQHGLVDQPVSVSKPRGRFEPLPLRLVILPKPATAASGARRKAAFANRKGQHRTCDGRTLLAAEHLILITSLPADKLPAQALKDLYAIRWQIELAFKRLKSILAIDRLPAKNPDLARAWLYAHLLFALIVDAIQPQPGDFPP